MGCFPFFQTDHYALDGEQSEASQVSSRLDLELRRYREDEKRLTKVLLLGAGEVGPNPCALSMAAQRGVRRGNRPF